MSTNELGAIEVGLQIDSGTFTKRLKDIQSRIRAVDSEFRVAASSMDIFDGSAQSLQTRSDNLNRKLQLQQEQVRELSREYRSAVESGNKTEEQLARLATRLNNATADMNRTRTMLNNVNREIAEQSNEWRVLGGRLESVSERFNNMGDRLKGVGQSLSAALTLPLAGIGAAALKMADDFDQSLGRIQAKTGETGQTSQELYDQAENLWKNAYGQNVEEAANAVSLVDSALGDLAKSTDEVGKITESAFIFRDAFDKDINESIKAARQLMSDFEVDGTQAFDMLTYAMQNGGDFAEDLLDTVTEYSPQFKALGYDAEAMMAVLVAGAQSGAFNLDKLGDVAKEGFLKISEGSDEVRSSLETMGLDADQIIQGINSGGAEAQSAFIAVSSALATITDPAERNAAAIAAFGTPLEDLGPAFQDFFSNVNGDLGEFEGATKKAGDAMYDNFGTRVKGGLRELQLAFQPIGEVLLGLAERVLPKISAATQAFATWMERLSPVGQGLVVLFGAIAAAIGPLIFVVSQMISAFGVISGWFSALSLAIAEAGGAMALLAPVISALTGPIAIIIYSVTALTAAFTLLYQKNETFRTKVQEIWGEIQVYLQVALAFIQGLITSVMSGITSTFGEYLDQIKAFWEANGEQIMSLVALVMQGIWENIKLVLGLIQGVFQVVWPIVSGIVKIAWELIEATIDNALTIILGVIDVAMKLLQGDWKGAWESIKNIAKDLMNNIIEFFKEIDLWQVGKDIIQGLIDGIGSMISAVKEKVNFVASLIPNGVKDFLNINSPSRVMRDEVGRWIPEGIAEGISRNLGSVTSAVQEMGQATIPKQNPMNTRTNGGEYAKNPTIIINPTPVNIDGNRFAEITFDHNDNQFGNAYRRSLYYQGETV